MSAVIEGTAPGAASVGWCANLDLSFARRGAATVLTGNLHRGPLQVQKALYPEGPAVCHVAVLHPPGGIAAGDALRIRANLGAHSGALLTTPGATKWYRSEDRPAQQHVQFTVGEGATLEWLPRENILFNGSRIASTLRVELAPHAGYVGWDILTFGRRAAGESWRQGRLHLNTRIQRGARVLWSEVADVDAAGGFARSPVGLSGRTVCGTFLMVGYAIDAAVLKACREIAAPRAARVGITHVPQVLIARYLGDSTEDAFSWFTRLWTMLRLALCGRVAHPPRVWAC